MDTLFFLISMTLSGFLGIVGFDRLFKISIVLTLSSYLVFNPLREYFSSGDVSVLWNAAFGILITIVCAFFVFWYVKVGRTPNE